MSPRPSSANRPTESTEGPSPFRAPHDQYWLPPLLYSRYQAPHFSGEVQSGGRRGAALGNSWANIVNSRVLLSRRGRDEFGQVRRFAEVVFSPFAMRGGIEFLLEEDGIRSVGEVEFRKSQWNAVGEAREGPEGATPAKVVEADTNADKIVREGTDDFAEARDKQEVEEAEEDFIMQTH